MNDPSNARSMTSRPMVRTPPQIKREKSAPRRGLTPSAYIFPRRSIPIQGGTGSVLTQSTLSSANNRRLNASRLCRSRNVLLRVMLWRIHVSLVLIIYPLKRGRARFAPRPVSYQLSPARRAWPYVGIQLYIGLIGSRRVHWVPVSAPLAVRPIISSRSSPSSSVAIFES